MKKFLIFSFFSVVMTCVCMAAPVDAFIGNWQVDYDATLASVKKSPKYDSEKDKIMLPKILRKIADRLILEITDKDVTFKLGERGNAMAYTVKSNKGAKTVLTGKMGETDVVLTLEARKKGRITIKSSMTDDMDYYVWEPKKNDKKKK